MEEKRLCGANLTATALLHILHLPLCNTTRTVAVFDRYAAVADFEGMLQGNAICNCAEGYISYCLCFYSYLFYLALLRKIIIKISNYLLTLTLRERSLTKTRNENMIAWSCIRGKLILVKM